MRIQTVMRYATGKSPLMGIPVFSVAAGKHITAVFRREHVQAGLDAGAIKASYDEREHTLTLNGTKHVCYRLKNLSALHGGHLQTWIIKDMQEAWASTRRKTAATRALPENERKIARLRAEIGKLERKRAKIYENRPVSPMRLTDYDRQPESQSARDYEMRWREQKQMRQALGRLVRQPRKTWAQFYRDVEAIIGKPVSADSRHDRVCARKRGPDRIDYLTYLYKYVWIATKPYRRQWKPYEPWDSQEPEMDSFKRHRRTQMEYLMHVNERVNLQAQIEQLQEEIVELQISQ